MAQTSILVYNSSELSAALRTATGGETIVLAPGVYGQWRFSDSITHSYSSPVTITSQDPNNQAIFKSINISNSQNLVLDHLTFDWGVDDPVVSDTFYALVQTGNISNVTIQNSKFVGATINDGSTKDGYGSGYGIKGTTVDGLVFENNEMINLNKAISVSQLDNSVINNNYIHDIRSDGIFIGTTTNTKITNNIIDDLTPWYLPNGAGDHGDMIQITKGIYNLEISGNYLNSGSNLGQGIFLPSSTVDPNESALIQNNIVLTGAWNGIFLNNRSNIDILNNILLDIDSGSSFPRFIVKGGSDNINVENNIVQKLVLNSGTSSTNNLILQDDDATLSNYFDKFFVDIAGNPDVNFDDVLSLPGVFDVFSATPGVDYSLFHQFVDWGIYTQAQFDQLLASTAKTVQNISLPSNTTPTGTVDDTLVNDDDNDHVTDTPHVIVDAQGYVRGSNADNLYNLSDSYADINDGAGADIYKLLEFSSGKEHRVRKFGDDDTLDISDILEMYDPQSDIISEFVRFKEVTWKGNTHTRVEIDIDGSADDHQFKTAIHLANVVDLDVDEMLSDGSLII